MTLLVMKKLCKIFEKLPNKIKKKKKWKKH